MVETDLQLGDGRTLHAYDAGAEDADGRLAVFWHHGSLNVGAPPEPLFPAAEELGIRWVSYDRPGYGGSTPLPDRNLASAAGYASAVADAWASTGSRSWDIPTAARTPWRAPRCCLSASSAWSAWPVWPRSPPMGSIGSRAFGLGGAAELRAAAAGRAALEKHLAESEDEPDFTPEDEAALAGAWSWFIDVVDAPALAGGTGRVRRRRPGRRRRVGLRPRRGSSLRPSSCTAAGTGSCPQRARRVARAPGPLGRTVAAPGRRARLDPQPQPGGPVLAAGARRTGLSPARYAGRTPTVGVRRPWGEGLAGSRSEAPGLRRRPCGRTGPAAASPGGEAPSARSRPASRPSASRRRRESRPGRKASAGAARTEVSNSVGFFTSSNLLIPLPCRAARVVGDLVGREGFARVLHG